MKKRIAILLFIAAFASMHSFAQRIIQGQVIDAQSKEPVELAHIRSVDETAFATADERGNFSLKITSSNQIIIGLIGYKSTTIDIDDFNNRILVALERAPLHLKEVYVTSNSVNAGFRTVSKIDMNLRPARSTQEFLQIVPGLFIAQHQGGGKAEQIFLRGFDADHGTDINVSVDGLPVNMVSHAHGQGYADLHFLIPETVKNIEYGKGPYYTAAGNLATAGSVRFSTLNVLDKNVFKLEAGQFNTIRSLGMFELFSKKQREKGTNAYIATEFLYTDGPFDVPQYFNRFNVFAKFNSRVGKHSRISLLASTLSSQWRASGQIPERAVNAGQIDRFGFIDSSEGGYTSRSNFSGRITSNLKAGTWDNQIYFSKYYFNLHSNFTFYLNDPVNGDQIRQRESRNIFGYTSRFTNNAHLGKGKLISELGAGFRFDRTNDSELSHTTNQNDILEFKQLGDVDEKNIFFFVDESFEKGPWLLNLGARLDYFHFDYFNELSNQHKIQRETKLLFPRKLICNSNPITQHNCT